MKAENIMTTVSLYPRHQKYLKALKRLQSQGASDTVRRALDEYMKEHPIEESDEETGDEVTK